MKKQLFNTFGFTLLCALLFTACATTTLTSVWKEQSYQGQPSKIMVIGVAKKKINRRIFEDEFVRQLKSRGTDAVASYTVLTEEKLGNHKAVAAKMKAYATDAVLITRLVSKKTVQTYVPGKVYHPPEKYGSWRDYYGYGADEVYTPGYMVEDEFALMESNLYSAGNDKLIWAATSEAELMGSDQDQIKSYIQVMVNAMAAQKLLK